MEVMPPTSPPDFHLHIPMTSPASPRLSGEPFNYEFHYTSAPTSPTRAAAIYSHFSATAGAAAGDLFDFAFDSGRISASIPLSEISSADELFDNGIIRPLHLPAQTERGRQKNPCFENRVRGSRSLSPLRDHGGAFSKNRASTAAPPPPKLAGGESRKWRLKDLLLFRSASEGRATGRENRDPLRKYALFPSFFTTSKKKAGGAEDSRAVRSTETAGGSVRRGGLPAASAHEIHYTANKAAAAEQRKKTPLAYQRQGLFGFIQYNPAILSITKGFTGNTLKP